MHHKIMTAMQQREAKRNLTLGTTVLRDGLACFATVADSRCTHHVNVVGQRKPRDLSQFRWVNTVLANLKTMLSGAYKTFNYRKYPDCYLGAFAYRFNGRVDLAGRVVRQIIDVCRTNATPERLIRGAGVHF
jgi:hypothetical protein